MRTIVLSEREDEWKAEWRMDEIESLDSRQRKRWTASLRKSAASDRSIETIN